MTLRLRILEYIKNNEDANFFQMLKDLDLRPDILAMELKTLKDKECVAVYKGGFYSLTLEGERELKQLKGEYSIPPHYLGK